MNKIKVARELSHLSIKDASEMMKIPYRTWQDWEACKRTPPEWAEQLIVEKLTSIRKGANKMNYKFDGKTLIARNSENFYWCTNDEGYGLFEVDEIHNERRQLRGTCQFDIVGITEKSAKRKIKNAIDSIYPDEME